MKTLVALKSFKYAGKRLAVGDKFKPVGAGTDKAIIALGMAEEAKEDAPKPVVVEAPKRTYVRKVVEAEDKPEEKPAPAAKKVAAKTSAWYKRRDLTAEE